jgi:putative transposase
MDVYASLSIRKERIEPRQAWQNLIEAHFTRARRMADARFVRARSWEEILAVYRRFVHDSNVQRNFAHESREDGCHSPAEVLGGQTGPPSVLDRILFATRDIRHLLTSS